MLIQTPRQIDGNSDVATLAARRLKNVDPPHFVGGGAHTGHARRYHAPVRVAALTLFACLALACGPEARGAEHFQGAALRSGEVQDVSYEVFAEGQGDETQVGDWVMVHYRLTLEDGTEVDSSHGKKPLAMFAGKDKKVIDGFQRGVVGMKVGELRRVSVPWHLGYGDRELPKIPAKSNLLFELELIKRDR